MVENDVQHHTNVVIVRGLDHRAQVVASSKVRVDVKKVLNAVAVVGVIGVDLFEDRAEPDGSYAQPAQVAHLGSQAAQVAADKVSSGISPRPGGGFISDGVAIVRRGEHGR